MIKIVKAVCLLALLNIAPGAVADTFKTKDGLTLDYAITGKGKPLVMLHSGMASRDDMHKQVSYFSKHYQVIALDSREQGRSGTSDVQISYQLMSDDVVALLDHLKLKKASLFGQSDGGISALMTAHNHPERVNKLMIHGAVFNYKAYPPEAIAKWNGYRWNANNPKDVDPEQFPGNAIKSYLLGQPDLSNFGKCLQEMSYMWATSPNLTVKDLQKIAVPTLVIVGDHYDVSLPHSLQMHEALSNSQLFVAPGATHYIHREKSELLNRVLHDFLRE
jgi:pimeloyl-ACP methyl ester carboxylesterase